MAWLCILVLLLFVCLFVCFYLSVSLPFRCSRLSERRHSGDDVIFHRQGLFLRCLLFVISNISQEELCARLFESRLTLIHD